MFDDDLLIVFLLGVLAIPILGGFMLMLSEKSLRKVPEVYQQEMKMLTEEEILRERSQINFEELSKNDCVTQNEINEARVKEFTLQEAPSLWETYQNLKAELAMQELRITELKRAFVLLDRDFADDSSLETAYELRTELEETLKLLRTKMDDAYLASCMYDAALGKKAYADLQRKILEDGIQGADIASSRFMREKN